MTNAFVIPEGGAGINGPSNFWDLMANEAQFHAIAAQIDHGITPFEGVSGDTGIENATAFINNWRSLTQNHADLQYAKQFIYRQQAWDPVNAMSLVQIARSRGPALHRRLSGPGHALGVEGGVDGGPHQLVLRADRDPRVRPHPRPPAQLHGQHRSSRTSR